MKHITVNVDTEIGFDRSLKQLKKEGFFNQLLTDRFTISRLGFK